MQFIQKLCHYLPNNTLAFVRLSAVGQQRESIRWNHERSGRIQIGLLHCLYDRMKQWDAVGARAITVCYRESQLSRGVRRLRTYVWLRDEAERQFVVGGECAQCGQSCLEKVLILERPAPERMHDCYETAFWYQFLFNTDNILKKKSSNFNQHQIIYFNLQIIVH